MPDFIKTVNSYLSDYILVTLLVGTGIFFSFKTRFVQLRCFKESLCLTFSGLFKQKNNNPNGISSFQALATAVAAQVGTGNILGACSAILTGGPGAIFWMWIIAFFSMATVYAEAVLAQQTKQLQPDGTATGGPVYYIKKAFPGPFGKLLCKFFSLSVIIALGLTGSMVQSNSISEVCGKAFGLSDTATGLIITTLSGAVLIGGVKTLSRVTEKLVPFMAVFYLLGGFAVLAVRAKYLPESFIMIFRYAFRPDAVIGGSVGYALKTVISQGVKRGLFSNEAGMGSTPHAHALADVESPHKQGLAAMFGVFIDTFCILTMTGLTAVSVLYVGDTVLPYESIDKADMAILAFSPVFGNHGAEIFIAICLLLFAFSSVIGWNCFGKMNFEYLFGQKFTAIYFTVTLFFIFLGSVTESDLVWECADLFNQLMVLPNVLALIALSPSVAKSAEEKNSSLLSERTEKIHKKQPRFLWYK